jgi:hypothetical protein
VFKKLYEQFRTGISAQPSQFEREVIAQLQNTMDRLHAENLQLRAENDTAYITVARLQRKLEIIADLTKSDFTPILISEQVELPADSGEVISASTSGTIA